MTLLDAMMIIRTMEPSRMCQYFLSRLSIDYIEPAKLMKQSKEDDDGDDDGNDDEDDDDGE